MDFLEEEMSIYYHYKMKIYLFIYICSRLLGGGPPF